MSDPVVDSAKETMLKRYAKAFYANLKAAKNRVVALFGDNEPPVREDEGSIRKTARLILAVPKWIGHGVVVGARIVLWAVGAVVGAIALTTAAAIIAVAAALTIVTLTAYKIVQLFALVLRTPYLLVRGDDCFKTDWVGYGNLWKPRYFHFTRISQVYMAQIAERNEVDAAVDRHPANAPALAVVHDRTKDAPTAKQKKTYPPRIPTLAGAEA
jgi:hypothetical protein